MTDLRQAAQQALEALERYQVKRQDFDRFADEITALRTALEQQAEPVAPKCGAIIEVFDKDWRMEYLSLPVGKHKLYTQQYIYTAPPQQQAEPVPQRKPLTDEQVNECGMCGYVGKDKDKTGQCPKCRWDELRPLTGKAHQKPLTDDQIYEMYNEPRSDAEMLEFARAIEAAHGIKEGT